MTKKQLSLGAFFMFPGHHVAAWLDRSTTKEQYVNFDFIREQAMKAEAAKFDTIFLADHVNPVDPDAESFEQTSYLHLEPFTVLSAIAAVTEKIGVVGTVSTTFSEPYNVARQFASLDRLSKGRAGWNVVTSSPLGAANFNNDVTSLRPEVRYKRAHEYVDVVTKLWNATADDVIVYDQQGEQLNDRTKVKPIDHEGEWFQVKGPLTVPRSEQGHAVIVQAGQSDEGKELAARTAEVVFTAWQSLEDAQAFYRDLKGRLPKYGRTEEDLKIMPGIFPVVGRTEEEAKAKHQALLDLIPVEAGVKRLSDNFGYDLSGYDVDGPLPNIPREQVNGIGSRHDLIVDLAKKENLTIRQLYQRISGGRGHYEVVGTAAQIADIMESWLENGAADGFNILAPTYPQGFDDFIELVIPELQRRGIFRTEYNGSTLREHLGLTHPTKRQQVTNV